MAEADTQLETLIDKFDAGNQDLIRSVRAALRARLPTANELVYDNYNFFVIGYSSTERPSDCIILIAAGANGVSLSFYRGADLEDEHGVLQGAENQNRFIRLASAATLAKPGVDALIQQAMDMGTSPLHQSTRGKLFIRSISAKQRPRRKD